MWAHPEVLGAPCESIGRPHGFQSSFRGAHSHLGKIGLTVTVFLVGTALSKGTLKKVGIRPVPQGITLWIIGTGTLALVLSNWIHI